MKKIILIISAVAFTLGLNAQTDIADARTFGLGQTVTVTGVVTNGSEFGQIRYMQDNTAGIAGYGGPVTGALRGDSVTITGPLVEFFGLLEVSTVVTMVNHGPAVVPVVPLQVSIPTVGEPLESQLVELQNLTFVQTGSFATNNNTVQVTDGVNTLDVRINASTNIGGTPIPTGPINLTGLVGQFNTNYQIVPRDLNDIVPYVAPAFEINVLVEGSTVLHTGNYFVGNTAVTNVVIENLGSTDLIISGSVFTGVDAADFSSNITTTTIAGGATQAFTVNYTASGIGSHFAAIEIASNDTDENPYIINFEGAGTDNLASEPLTNPTALNFPTIEAYSLAGQYTAGAGASNYIVLWKKGSPITGSPADGVSYMRGDIVGDATVAYIGPGTSFTPRAIRANQNYYFEVYAFNGQGGFENYLTVSPAVGNVTSTGSNIAGYYGTINATNSTLITDLNSLINPHTPITYFMYTLTMMDNFEVRDTVAGQSVVTCVYSGENLVFADPFNWTSTGYSREHTFAHSWMQPNPVDNPELPQYNDQHNLYPTNLAEANSPRSNHPLGVVTGAISQSYLDGKRGLDANGMTVYEPRDSQKGNAARAIMYMAVAYGFDLNGNVNSTDQDQDLLKTWHLADLPDDYEIARHEYIFNLQGNRNPFIDSVEFACHIDFDNLLYLGADCATISVGELSENSVLVYPIPASNYVTISADEQITSIEMIDMQGRVVLRDANISSSKLNVDVSTVESGSYLIQVTTTKGSTQRKVIIE